MLTRRHVVLQHSIDADGYVLMVKQPKHNMACVTLKTETLRSFATPSAARTLHSVVPCKYLIFFMHMKVVPTTAKQVV
jgi:hypothetical protein